MTGPAYLRRALATFLVTVVVIGATALLWLAAGGMPLPWRGPVTRRIYVELMLGRLPMLHCDRDARDSVARRRARNDDLPAVRDFACDGLRGDSTHGVTLDVGDRTVRAMRRSWWVHGARGPAFADSVVRRLADAR